MDSQQWHDAVIASVTEASRRGPATVDDVAAELRSRYNQTVDTGDVMLVLQQLASAGALDRVDATPGTDGLPVYGFQLPRTDRTVSGRVRRK